MNASEKISISTLWIQTCALLDAWWFVVCLCVFVLILESVTFYRQRRFKNFLNHINHSILLELIVRSYRQILYHVILLHSVPFYLLLLENIELKRMSKWIVITIFGALVLPSSFVSRDPQNATKKHTHTHNICLEMEIVIIFDLLPAIFIWLWNLFIVY